VLRLTAVGGPSGGEKETGVFAMAWMASGLEVAPPCEAEGESNGDMGCSSPFVLHVASVSDASWAGKKWRSSPLYLD
jgi:hypothetical protein